MHLTSGYRDLVSGEKVNGYGKSIDKKIQELPRILFD
jgi:hypothetical protein